MKLLKLMQRILIVGFISVALMGGGKAEAVDYYSAIYQTRSNAIG